MSFLSRKIFNRTGLQMLCMRAGWGVELIAQDSEVVRYLGCPIGFSLKTSTVSWRQIPNEIVILDSYICY